MAKQIVEINTNKIYKSDPLKASVISIIGIIEGFLSKVSTRHHFRSIKSSSIKELTFEELGNIFRQYFQNDDGKHGVCWEYTIYNSIKYNDEFVIDLLNDGINIISGLRDNSYLEAILWGGEKNYKIVNKAEQLINENDLIWTPYGTYKFKNHIKNIYNSFSKNEIRSNLPNHIQDIWKTDLFVKKENSNLWFSITVKWRKNQLKKHSGLTLGVCYIDEFFIKKRIENCIDVEYDSTNTFIDFVKCSIPFKFDLGEYFVQNFNLVINMFENIHKQRGQIDIFKFDTKTKKDIFRFFYSNRGESCVNLLSYLQEEFRIYLDKSIEAESISETTLNNRGLIFEESRYTDWQNKNKALLLKPNNIL